MSDECWLIVRVKCRTITTQSRHKKVTPRRISLNNLSTGCLYACIFVIYMYVCNHDLLMRPLVVIIEVLFDDRTFDICMEVCTIIYL